MSLEIEKSESTYMNLEQFELWLKPGVLGFYRSCEVTVCGLLDHDGKAHNLFTILVFEDRGLSSGQPVFLTEKNERFGDGLRLLVAQYRISLDTSVGLFRQITAGSRQLPTPLGPLETAPLMPVPAYFVPKSSTVTIPVNELLKNNFRGGMAMEWFGGRGAILRILKETNLQQVALRVRELLPLDLFTLSDHIGNVLFQFPQGIAYCKLSHAEPDSTCSVIFDERVQSIERYSLSVFTAHDELLMDHHAAMGREGNQLELNISNTGGPYVVALTDMEYGIPILRQTTSTLRQVNGVVEIRGDADSVRAVRLPDGATEQITINSVMPVSAGHAALPWEEAIRERQYEKRMEDLTRRREFIRYGRAGDERAKALADLRRLMNEDPLARVCLWDPYLTAQDLLETWYFTDIYGKELRAITSNVIPQKTHQSLDSWKTAQRDALAGGSDQFGINLRWRVQHGLFGFSFHDRFLIRIPREGAPSVWSLGTSVNGLGKAHHILQQVANPQYILDDFEELWAALEDESCQIWNSREARSHG